jgi:hypothetical protein
VNQKKTVEIVCPCCDAKITIDAKLGAILSHEPPPASRAHMEMNLTDAARRLQDEAARRDDVFAQSIEAQKKHSDVLARKFEEQFKKVKDQPIEKPHRDIDFD